MVGDRRFIPFGFVRRGCTESPPTRRDSRSVEPADRPGRRLDGAPRDRGGVWRHGRPHGRARRCRRCDGSPRLVDVRHGVRRRGVRFCIGPRTRATRNSRPSGERARQAPEKRARPGGPGGLEHGLGLPICARRPAAPAIRARAPPSAGPGPSSRARGHSRRGGGGLGRRCAPAGAGRARAGATRGEGYRFQRRRLGAPKHARRCWAWGSAHVGRARSLAVVTRARRPCGGE